MVIELHKLSPFISAGHAPLRKREFVDTWEQFRWATDAVAPMRNLPTGVSLNGIMASVRLNWESFLAVPTHSSGPPANTNDASWIIQQAPPCDPPSRRNNMRSRHPPHPNLPLCVDASATLLTFCSTSRNRPPQLMHSPASPFPKQPASTSWRQAPIDAGLIPQQNQWGSSNQRAAANINWSLLGPPR